MHVKSYLFKAGKIALVLGISILFIISMGMIAYSVSNEVLTPLPYMWYMIGLRILVFGYVYYKALPKYRFGILIIAALSEVHIYWLHSLAVEGLLW